ncbi:MAG: hypothetical protein ABIH42_06665 [Planctomycetota bacterium]
MNKIKTADLSKLKKVSLSQRKSKVSIEQFCKLPQPSQEWKKFLNSLPQILVGNSMRTLVSAIVNARKSNRHVVLAMGAHVVKCGLSPLIIDLMEKGIITAIATNGATAVHDYEIAAAGCTSEDVQEQLNHCQFGTVRETAEILARAAIHGARDKTGFGKSLGELIYHSKNKYRKLSVIAAGARLGIPVTLHVAIGTDIYHMHYCLNPAALGESTHIDFKIFCNTISRLEGGVFLNVGSAVIMPEVFLKALAFARASGATLKNFTTCNMDMIRHYRPQMNVVERPGGTGLTIIGHHEINLPLLRLLVLSSMSGKKRRS